jgi:hypothetical protein
MPSAALAEEEEREQIQWALASLRARGVEPRGWLGPEYGESPRTPTLLAAAGFEFVCDWCCDEQPFFMANGLTAFPLMADLDDAFAIAIRGVSVLAYGKMLQRAFDQLYADGAYSARLLAFLVRPFVIGQPSRVGIFEEVLARWKEQESIWKATPSAVVDWFREHPWEMSARRSSPFSLEGRAG